ncbi:MAG: hypothetical protein E7470_08375 [Ruminococcaceae bacterium]|nr:hypothetical protein [Oscillospiraceae bacterium]
MRHWWIYIILYSVVGLFGLSPFTGTDIAKLSPIEVIWLEEEKGWISIVTDGDNQGYGATVSEAIANMKSTAPGTVFLDTADFLIVKKGDESLITQITELLRQSCSVCTAETRPNMQAAAKFLRAHEPSVKLKHLDDNPSKLPLLELQRGRLILIENTSDEYAACGVADRCVKCAHSEPCGQD